jgi:RNA polymerase sigma-70 factor, ECF subfamily
MATERTPTNPLRASDDHELLRRMAERVPDALAELYDRHAPLLLAVSRRILGSAPEAEEALQETFLQAWGQAGRYDPARSSVSTWLVLLCRSRALDRLRQRLSRDRTAAAAELEPQAPDASGRLDEHVLFRERRERVRTALDGLPSEQRQVLEMAFYEGLSQSEIAERTATPLGTVKTRSLLAMKKLRRDLRDEVRELI